MRVDAGPLDNDWRSLADLVSDAVAIEDWLDYEASFTTSLGRRGRAAYLMTDYCRVLAAAAVPLFVGKGCVADLRPELIALRYSVKAVEHDGRSVDERQYELRFLSSAPKTCQVEQATGSGSREAFRIALESNLAPLVERLHETSGLSRSAFWRLAGDAVAVAFLEAGRRLGCEQRAKEDAMALLKVSGSPLNNKQLGFFDVAIDDPERPGHEILRRTFRARGGCCRYYTAEGGSLCATCVLKDKTERDSDIANAMRQFLATGRVDSKH